MKLISWGFGSYNNMLNVHCSTWLKAQLSLGVSGNLVQRPKHTISIKRVTQIHIQKPQYWEFPGLSSMNKSRDIPPPPITPQNLRRWVNVIEVIALPINIRYPPCSPLHPPARIKMMWLWVVSLSYTKNWNILAVESYYELKYKWYFSVIFNKVYRIITRCF